MSNMPSLKRKPFQWPTTKSTTHYARTGTITAAAQSARTAKQIEQQTPVLRDWYQFIAESKVRVP